MSHLLRTVFRSRVTVPLARPISRRTYSIAAAHPAPTNPSASPKHTTSNDTLPQLETPVPDNIKLQPKRLSIGSQGNWYLYTLLRDSCKCPTCVDQHSKQRNFRTTDIPADIRPRSLKWVDGKLEVQWANDIKGYDAAHTSTYDPAVLRNPTAIARRGDGGLSRKRVTWNREAMRQVQHWISYEDYINDEAKFATAMHQLALTGLIFVKGIPDSREMVEKIATRMGPLRNTFYGPTWDVRSVPQAKNVAYTNVFLGFHMDLMYMNEPPGFQLLHCLQNSCDGGESLFVDGFYIARRLALTNPTAYRRLTQLRLNYEYNHQDHKYNNQWPVFEVDPAAPDRLLHINYSPPFQGPLHHSHQDAARLEPQLKALREFSDLLEDERNTFELKLNPGECVIFENRRVLHARRQFNTASGSRWLAGAYVDEDAVVSRFNVSRSKQKDGWYSVPPGVAEFTNARLAAKATRGGNKDA